MDAVTRRARVALVVGGYGRESVVMGTVIVTVDRRLPRVIVPGATVGRAADVAHRFGQLYREARGRPVWGRVTVSIEVDGPDPWPGRIDGWLPTAVRLAVAADRALCRQPVLD